ncbi:MAG: hypothetical protein WD708_05330 [Kiritimatiellia bacterium]
MMKTTTKLSLKGILGGLTAVALVMGTAHAQVIKWDGEADPDRNWTTATNWDGDIVPATGDDVEFSSTGVGVVEVDTNVNVGSIRFMSNDYTLQGNQIAIAPSGTYANYDIYIGGERTLIDSNLRLEGDVVFSGTNLNTVGDRPIINGVISEDGTPRSLSLLADSRAKRLSLRGANTYSGGTTVSNANLEIGHNSALGTGTFTVQGGGDGSWIYVTQNIALANAVSFQGDMMFGRYAPLPGSLTLNGPISIDAAGVSIEEHNINYETPLVLAGAITDNGNGVTLIANRQGRIELKSANTITGDVTFDARGSGHIWTSADNSESGLLELGGEGSLGSGTLRITSNHADLRNGVIYSEGAHLTIDNNIAIIGSGANIGIGSWNEKSLTLTGEFDSSAGSFNILQINPLSALAGTGTVAANDAVIISGNATLSPGNILNTGELTIDGKLTMQNNSIYEYDGGDLVDITGEAAFSDWILNLDGTDLVIDGSSSILLFTYGTGAIGDPSQVNYSNFDTTPTGLTFTDNGSEFYVNGLAVIPESSSYLLVMIGMTALFFLRKTKFGRK